MSYSFRVSAKNASGSSKPVGTEHRIMVKDDVSKPVVDTKALYMGSISVKAGEDVRVKLPVFGKIILTARYCFVNTIKLELLFEQHYFFKPVCLVIEIFCCKSEQLSLVE